MERVSSLHQLLPRPTTRLLTHQPSAFSSICGATNRRGSEPIFAESPVLGPEPWAIWRQGSNSRTACVPSPGGGEVRPMQSAVCQTGHHKSWLRRISEVCSFGCLQVERTTIGLSFHLRQMREGDIVICDLLAIKTADYLSSSEYRGHGVFSSSSACGRVEESLLLWTTMGG